MSTPVLGLALLASASVLLAAPQIAATPAPTDVPQFRLTLLPAPEGAQQLQATALDEVGRVVGTSTQSIFVESVYWPGPESAPIVATGEGAGFAIPYDLNAFGWVVGSGAEGGSAYVWIPGSEMTPLPLPGPCCPSANAINDAGLIVGFAAPPAGGQLPTRWVNFVPEALGLLAGDTVGYLMDVNDAGHSVGQSGQEAAFWMNNVAERLPFAGPVLFSIAHELNDFDEVVGEVTTGGPSRAVVWRALVPKELPSLGGTWSVARAINNSSWIVGLAQGVPSPVDVNVRAALWIDDLPLDLNALTLDLPAGIRLVTATDVNDAGMIVGEAYSFADGKTQAFLLEPVSEAWTDLGHGLPGYWGQSLLYGTGPLEAGSPFALSLAGAAPGAPTTLVLGFAAAG
ncbi:MAG TPA: hypothetical protein VFD43_01045, partial [Planctomycetota bacterium]|nr:hypothetical protein [Planctomycetota bacterium]